MKYFFPIIILLIVCIPISSQNINGYVMDSYNNPLSDVICILTDDIDFAFNEIALTDSTGFFQFDNNRLGWIYFSRTGFNDYKIKCIKSNVGTVTLAVNTSEINAAVIKEDLSLFKAIDGKLVYNISAIGANKLIDNAHTLIKELPMVICLDGNSLELIGSKGTTICFSGRKTQMDQNQIYDYLKSIPSGRVEKIEVITNPPPHWQVEGAIINVILKSGNLNTINGMSRGSYTNQTIGSYDISTSIYGGLRSITCNLAYIYSDNRSIKDSDIKTEHTLPNETYRLRTVSESLNKKSMHSVYSELAYKFNENNHLNLTYSGRLTPNSKVTELTESTLFNDSHSVDNITEYLNNISLNYFYNKFRAGIEYTNYNNTGYQNLSLKENDLLTHWISYYRKQTINKYKIYFNHSPNLQLGWNLNYGIDFSFVENRNYQNNNDSKDRVNTYSDISVIDEHNYTAFCGASKAFINGNLLFNAYLSGEYYRIDDYKNINILPNISIMYTPSEDHIIQLGYSSDKSYPSYWERQDYKLYQNEYIIREGNPLLLPATSHYVTAEYIYKEKYLLQASYYKVKDFSINQAYQSAKEFKLLYKTINLDNTESIDFTIGVPITIGRWLQSDMMLSLYSERYVANNWNGLSYNRNKWTPLVWLDNHLFLSQKPKITLNILLGYKGSTIQGIWDLGSVWGTNVGLKWECLKNRGVLSIQCNDLFETMYPSISTRFELQKMDIIQNTYRRSVSISFSYRFNEYKNKDHNRIDNSRFGIK